MCIDKARQQGLPFEIDDLRLRPGQFFDLFRLAHLVNAAELHGQTLSPECRLLPWLRHCRS
jgi:hypothetical protein